VQVWHAVRSVPDLPTRELIKWAETLGDPAVLQLLNSLGELEVRSNALSRTYMVEYQEFCDVFKQILFEKEELNGMEKAQITCVC
jgi:hypothetical protein